MRRATSHIDTTGASINHRHRLRAAPMSVTNRTAIIRRAIGTRASLFRRRPRRALFTTATRRSAARHPLAQDHPRISVLFHHRRRQCRKMNHEVNTDIVILWRLSFRVYQRFRISSLIS